MQIWATEYGFFSHRDVTQSNHDGSITAPVGSTVLIATCKGVFVEILSDNSIVETIGDDDRGALHGGCSARIKTLPDPGLTAQQIDENRKEVRRTVADRHVHGLDIPDKLTSAIAWFQERLNEIPDDCRDSATLDIGQDWECGETYANLAIKFYQPESDEEVINRIKIENERKRLSEQGARAEYEALKQRFENC